MKPRRSPRKRVGDNDTDQQKFASVANTDGAWTLTSKLPDGTTNNQAAIDKTPIVRVELVDVNNKNAVVDVRYFKVQWLKEKIAPVDLKVLKTFDYTLTCDAFKGSFTWEEMVTKVLGKLGENGLSQAEFIATYAAPEIAATDHTVGTVAQAAADGVELLYNFDATAAESAAAFTWTLTPEQIGNVIADLIAGKEVKKVVNVTIPAQNVYQGKLTFSFVVTSRSRPCLRSTVTTLRSGTPITRWLMFTRSSTIRPVHMRPAHTAMNSTVCSPTASPSRTCCPAANGISSSPRSSLLRVTLPH